MGAKECAAKIISEFELKTDAESVTELVEAIETKIGAIKRGEITATPRDIKRLLTRNVEKDLALQKQIKRRNAVLNRYAQVQLYNTIQQVAAGQATEIAGGIVPIKIGVDRALLGSIHGSESVLSHSALMTSETRANDYMKKLIELDRTPGLLKRLERGEPELQREVMHAMWAKDTGNAPTIGISADAKKAADVLWDLQQAMKHDMNGVGAFIGESRGGHVHKQISAWERFQPDKSKGETMETVKRDFTKQMHDDLDFEATFGMSRAVYENNPAGRFARMVDDTIERWFEDFSSGNHKTLDSKDAQRGAGTGSTNAARSVSQERQLIFKDADAWGRYQGRFGEPTLLAGFLSGVRSSARTYAILKHFGPNYEANIQAVAKRIGVEAKRDKTAAGLELSRKMDGTHYKQQLEDAIRNLDGRAYIPANPTLASWTSAMLKWNSARLLGSTLLTQFGDAVTMGGEVRLQGGGLIEGEINFAKNALRIFADDFDEKELAMAWGTGMEVATSLRVNDNQFLDYTKPGSWVERWHNKAMKLTLVQQMTEAQRVGFTIMFASKLASDAVKPFGKIDPGMRKILEIAGINESQFNLLRTGIDERTLYGETARIVDIDKLRTMTDTPQMKAHLKQMGLKDTAFWRRQEMDTLVNKLQAYMADTTKSGVIELKPELQSKRTLGTNPGTVMGSLLSMASQFKGWPMAFMHQRMGRDVAVRRKFSAAEKAQMSAFQSSGYYAVAALAVEMTAAGALINFLKDIAKNQTPRDPTRWDTWGQAFLTGGGATIFGDLLASETNRYGMGVIGSLAGPSAQTVKSATRGLLGLAQIAFSDDDKQRAILAESVRAIHNHIPLNNLFYTRAISDYMLNDVALDYIKPGSNAARWDRIQRDYGQERLIGDTP